MMSARSIKLSLTFLAAWLLVAAGQEMYAIAWGTGKWWGEFSPRWAAFFLFFLLGEALFFIFLLLVLWRAHSLSRLASLFVRWRKRWRVARWLLVVLCLLLPVWFFQYTPWGIVVRGQALRGLIWSLEVICLAFLLTSENLPFSFAGWAWAILLSGFSFATAASLHLVTSFPFSLGWSEGNRLWDYSMLFAAQRYSLLPGQARQVHLSLGRQLVGGLPFLYPGLTIAQARLWLGITYILPYIVLGWVMFWKARSRPAWGWLMAGIWGALFLLQGPIHPPLIFAALLTVLAWGSSLWVGIPLLVLSAYFAEISRYTWAFAPAMWIGMLEWVSDPWEGGRLSAQGWKRVVSLVAAGLFGGTVLPNLIARFQKVGEGFSFKFTEQPLLWYRLFPNATFAPGILLALLVAIGPVIALVLYRILRGEWRLNLWQKMALLAPLLAFLIVGLIASTKIGGGGDLHNLDMLLLGILFVVALAWRDEDFLFVPALRAFPFALSVLILVLPAWAALPRLAPLQVEESMIPTLLRLTDTEVNYKLEPERARRALAVLPQPARVEQALRVVRQAVEEAKARGEVLFMDQRQLLTFGYVQAPLVVEYEKKFLMDQAMAANADFFRGFYADLAAHRFVLIISEPLYTPIKDTSYAFSEENNAWVIWVSRPLLCYYTPVETIEDMRLQLLIPNPQAGDCSEALPQEVGHATP
uniref:Uncharacterized protein n=1 Tax=uncultured Chloroflexota bacterium TaxID=166587 RepID=H5SQ62_9CHLR|nr:hypothetical protein HGMM_F55G01C26 [uncultured Chloroflexota bacterium]